MTFTRLAIAAAVFVAGLASQAAAMTFETATDTPACAARPCVVASGMIERDASKDLQRFLKARKIGPGAVLVLDSQGGNLLESLMMGDVVRKAGLATTVREGGACASACVYAFLGGVERTVGSSGRIGVHQVAAGGPGALTASDSQWLMSMVAVHLSRMCGGMDLLIPALRTRPQDMHWLSAHELTRYGVVTAERVGQG